MDSMRSSSLVSRVLLWVLPPTIILLAVLAWGFMALNQKARDAEATARLEQMFDHGRDLLRETMREVQAQVRALAVNDLVVNGLVDVMDQDRYLPVFFRSLRAVAGPGIQARFVLFDFQGREILANQVPGYEAAPKDVSRLAAAVVAGEAEVFRLDRRGLFFAVPVRVHGYVEGALSLNIHPVSLQELFQVWERLDYPAALLETSGSLLAGNQAYRDHFSAGQARIPDDWIVVSRAGPADGLEDLRLLVGLSVAQAHAGQAELRTQVGLMLAVAILAVLAAIVAAARLTARPVARLGRELSELAHKPDLGLRLPDSNLHEIQVLTDNFNRSLAFLEQAFTSNARLNQLMGNNPAVVYAYSMDQGASRLRYISDNLRVILGFSPDVFISSMEFWASCVHPDDLPRLERKLTGVASRDEYRFLDDQGNYRWLADSQTPVANADGSVEVVGAWWDITERKRIEDKLAVSEDRFSRAIAGTGAGLWDWDMVENAVYFSPLWKSMLGYEDHEIENDFSGWKSLWHPEDAPRVEKAINDHLEEKTETYEIEHRLRHKDGSWRWIVTRGDIHKDTTGKMVRWVGTNIDTTDRKQAEEKLHKYAQQLELNNIELDAALAMAEEASRAKGEFLANMSHEIRTPMNAVIGLSDLLMHTDLNDKQRNYLTKINSSSRMLLGVINDILDFSKIEAGRLELDPHPFRLDELLDQMKTLFAATADEKGLELLFRVAPNVPRALMGDSLRLGQILTNLLSNALKFTESGQVEVGIMRMMNDECGMRNDEGNAGMLECWNAGIDEAGRSKGEEGRGKGEAGSESQAAHNDPAEPATSHKPQTATLRFTIRDTGIGMDEEQAGRLFQAFTQADTSTTRRYGGTGLGLIISQRLVESMGGVIVVESAPGQGSVFSFELSLPVVEGDMSRLECPETSRPGARVLVADDQAVAREVLREILESCRLVVTEADSGRAAVQAVVEAEQAGTPFDFILMDWKMPGELDGLQAIARLRQLREEGVLSGPSVPVAIISAYSRDDMPSDHSSFNAFLAKPVTASALMDAMIEATGGALQAPSTPVPVKEKTTIPSFAGCSILLVEDNLLNQEVALEMLRQTGATVTIANNGAVAVDLALSRPFDLILMDLQMPVMDGFTATRRIRAAEVHGSRFNGSAVEREEVQGSRFNGSTVDEREDGGVAVGATGGRPSAGPPSPTVNREPLNREPSKTVNREPLNLEPYDREPLNREPRTPIIALSAAVMEADRNRAREAGMDGHLAKPISSAELYQTLGQWLEARAEARPVAVKDPEEKGAEAGNLLPESLAGFDMELGLRRFEGDAAFYLKMLHSFKKQLDVEFAAMPEMLERLDQQDEAQVKVVSRMAHTLKGLAAMVGAMPLADAARAIDQAFKGNAAIAGELRLELAQALDLELAQARGQLAGLHRQQGQDVAVSPEQAASAMNRLLAGLRAGELVDEDLLAAVTGFLRGRLGEKRTGEFINLVEEFELNRAADLLEDMAREV